MEPISKELSVYYNKVSVEYISIEMKERLHKLADQIVDEYIRNTDIETVFTKKIKAELGEEDIIVIKMKAAIK